MLLLSQSFAYWKVQRDSWVFMWRGGMGLLNCDLTLRHKSLLSNKEKKAMLLVVFLIGHALWFCGSIFLGAQFGAQVKLHARKMEVQREICPALISKYLVGRKFCDQKFSRFFRFSPIFWKIKTAKIFIFWKLSK